MTAHDYIFHSLDDLLIIDPREELFLLITFQI